MEQLNRIELRGNVGTVKYTPGGNPPFAHFSLATSKAYRGKGGEAIIETQWHNVVAFEGRNIKDLEKLTKGAKVYVVGRLKDNRFTGSDGVERTVTDVIANRISFIDDSEPLECEI